MNIARFVAEDGSIHWGRMAGQREAQILRGSVFDSRDFESAATPVIKFLAPIDPPNIFAIGLNYRRHALETGAPLPDAPLIFLKASTSLTSTAAAISLPHGAPDEVDYEAELAIVIGRTARRVPVSAALSHVLGYTCANDVSARDCQKRIDRQWTRGKSFDTFCPMGPWLATADSLDPDHSGITSRLNGQIMQASNTSDMIFSSAELVSYLSQQFTLRPGTVILTGTPEGVGTARKPPVYLRKGDKIEVEVEGIGVLENYVTHEADA